MMTSKWSYVLVSTALVAGCQSKSGSSEGEPAQKSAQLKASGESAGADKAMDKKAKPGEQAAMDKKGMDEPAMDKPGMDEHGADKAMGKDAMGKEGMDKPAMPKMMETTPTMADKLGTLPAGIGIPVGKTAPDVELTTLSGQTEKLSKLYADGPILLTFYRGGWCPFCNFQVHSLAAAQDKFKALGVTPVLVSVDQPAMAEKTRTAQEIPFPVLSDSQLAVHKAFKVLNVVDDATLTKMHEMGLDLEAQSGQKHHTIAVPSMFLIDQHGKVLFAHADSDYKVRPAVEPLLAKLREALKK